MLVYFGEVVSGIFIMCFYDVMLEGYDLCICVWYKDVLVVDWLIVIEFFVDVGIGE